MKDPPRPQHNVSGQMQGVSVPDHVDGVGERVCGAQAPRRGRSSPGRQHGAEVWRFDGASGEGKGEAMAATRHYERIISADSHVMEPYDLWWGPLGQKFGDRTPRLLNEYRGRQGTFFYSGNTCRPVPRSTTTGWRRSCPPTPNASSGSA